MKFEKKTKPEKGNICDKTHMKWKGRKKTKSHEGSQKWDEKKPKSHEGNAKWEKKRNCSNGSLEPMF